MWSSPKIRKKFFDEFAAKEGFDPNVATNWYRYQLEQISFTKVILPSLFYSILFILFVILLLIWPLAYVYFFFQIGFSKSS